jgi:hypothetical protein
MLINSIAKLNFNINLQYKYNTVNNIQINKISKIPALSHNIIIFYSVLDKDDGNVGNVIYISNTASVL